MRRVRRASGVFSGRISLVLEMPATGIDAVRMHLSEPRRNDLLHFGDSDHGQLLDEKQEPHREPAEAAAQNGVVDPRRTVACPLPGLELMRQRRYHDDEP